MIFYSDRIENSTPHANDQLHGSTVPSIGSDTYSVSFIESAAGPRLRVNNPQKRKSVDIDEFTLFLKKKKVRVIAYIRKNPVSRKNDFSELNRKTTQKNLWLLALAVTKLL